ncbi:MAG: hypothetical protein ABFS03_14450, partial [Chloroflexota bacterium]
MLMGSENVSINYVELGHLGRSSKQLPADDTVFNDDGSVQSIGSNPRARYPLHFHRAGFDSMPATVNGSAVFFGPGWGFVNHGSHVDMSDNVAYGVAGASFVTERGDEQGSFTGNFSAGSYGGSNTKWHKRGGIEDFGHTGNGFWFQGLNITVNDNIASGCDDACFNFVAKGIDGISDRTVSEQRIIAFNNNTAYNSSLGLKMWGMRNGSIINNFKAYAVNTGVINSMTRYHTYNGTVLVAAETADTGSSAGYNTGTGLSAGYKSRSFTYRNSYIVGFGTGLAMPWGDGGTVENGYFDNDTDIEITPTGFTRTYAYNIKGDITFANDLYNIAFSYNNGKLEKRRHLYSVRSINLDIESMGNKYEAYDFSQAAGYVPFTSYDPGGAG